MKQRLAWVGLVLSGLALCACQTAPPDTKASAGTPNASPARADAASPDPKTVEEVREVLARHDKALNDKSIEAVMATFSTDPGTVLLGTGEGERFVGPQAIREAYAEIFKDYDAGTLNSACDWKTGGADAAGTAAWLAATCRMSDSLKNARREYVLNVSAALEKPGGQWRFRMLHMSNAPAGGPPPPPTADAPGRPGR